MNISYVDGNIPNFSTKVIDKLKKGSTNFYYYTLPKRDQILECYNNSDLIVWDWCKNGIEYLTSLPKKCKIIVLAKAGDIIPRLEYTCIRARCKFEGISVTLNHVATYRILDAIDWPKIDLLLFESNHILKEFKSLYPKNPCKKDILLCRDFTYTYKTKFTNTISIVCRIVVEKKIEFAIESFCNDSLNHMNLIIKGPDKNRGKGWCHEEYFTYLKTLAKNKENIKFVDWGDPTELYQNSDIILSTSHSEGIASSVMEGMSFGCVPFLRPWIGASEMYPTASFTKNPDDLRNDLLKWSNLSIEDKILKSKESTDFIKNHLDIGAEDPNRLEKYIDEVMKS